jgi:Kef-type K+ transport system membrane component KefB
MSVLIPPADDFLVQLFILLSAAIAAGEIANRFGVVPLVGQLLVGIILGPTLLGSYIALGSTTLPPELAGIQFLATFFIMFMAGLHVDPDEIARMKAKTAFTGVAIFAVPFVIGAFTVALLEPRFSATLDLFTALTLSITALPVLGIMVSEFGLTGKRLGNFVMSASLVNELTAVTVFAVLLQLTRSGGPVSYEVAIAILALVLFLGGVLLISRLVRYVRESAWWRARPNRFSALLRSREAGFAILMSMALGGALYSQVLGLTFLVGAFYAGLLITQAVGDTGQPRGARTFVTSLSDKGLQVTQPVSSSNPYRAFDSIFTTMNWMFFIPLFFAFVGIEMNLRLLGGMAAVTAVAVLTAVAILSKFGTGTALARWQGITGPDAPAAGFLLSSRGAVELAMAVVLLADGIFNTTVFTLVAFVGLLTTLLSPMFTVAVWRSNPVSRAELEQRVPAYRKKRPLPSSPSAPSSPPPPPGPPSPPR